MIRWSKPSKDEWRSDCGRAVIRKSEYTRPHATVANRTVRCIEWVLCVNGTYANGEIFTLRDAKMVAEDILNPRYLTPRRKS